MPAPTPPSWIQVRSGTIPVVLFAPHGGRRLIARQPGRHKVNDLHTADVTHALAARTGATAIVNATRDRNELDLNRITQVRQDAPWLPTLLADVLEREVARAGRATLLVIHGWNIGQPACDVGVGMVERAGVVTEARAGSRTVSSRFVDETLPRLHAAAAAFGVALTVGARYPAAHPNNLMQLFTPTYAQDPDPGVRRLGMLAAAGSIDAAQLELSIPLRWPGALRDTFLELLASALTGTAPAGLAKHLSPPLPSRLACGGRPSARRALQFVQDDLFALSAVEVGEAGSIGGRLLLSTAARTVELFTGELGDRTGPRWHVPPLRYGDDPDQWDLHYRGNLLSFGSLEPFLDLENGLADGRLMAAEIMLEFRAHDPGTSSSRVAFGDLTGHITMGERTIDVRTIALCTDGAGPPVPGLPSLRLVAPHTPFGSVALASTTGEARDGALHFALAGHAHLPTHRESLNGSATLRLTGNAATLAVRVGDHEVVGRVERLIPIRRPGKPGTVLHTTYGLCHLEHPRSTDPAGTGPGGIGSGGTGSGGTGPGGTGWIELVTEHPIPVNATEA